MSDNNGWTFIRQDINICFDKTVYHDKWHILFIDSLSPLIHPYIKKNKIAKQTSLAKECKKNNSVV